MGVAMYAPSVALEAGQ